MKFIFRFFFTLIPLLVAVPVLAAGPYNANLYYATSTGDTYLNVVTTSGQILEVNYQFAWESGNCGNTSAAYGEGDVWRASTGATTTEVTTYARWAQNTATDCIQTFTKVYTAADTYNFKLTGSQFNTYSIIAHVWQAASSTSGSATTTINVVTDFSGFYIFGAVILWILVFCFFVWLVRKFT